MKTNMNVAKLVSVTLAIGLMAIGCSKSASFSLLSDTATFTQNSASTNGKIDILFVIDNSGSMAASQQALADNIPRFFDKFDTKGFDYQIAVTTTEAWRTQFGGPASLAQFKDGLGTTHTGYFVVTPTTPNRQSVFITNVKQGTGGNGDERGFQSIQSALESSLNSSYSFPRPDAFLSVIIMTDGDDLSTTVSTSLPDTDPTAQQSDPNLIPVQKYVDYLDTKMGVVGGARSGKYNVNSIGVMDSACKAQVSSGGENKIGIRDMQLATATNGINGSLCGDFGTTLSDISYKIIQLRTRFFLDRQINPATLHVFINSVEVPVAADVNSNGYIYNSADNSVSFFGTAVPAAGAQISVSFDPTTIR